MKATLDTFARAPIEDVFPEDGVSHPQAQADLIPWPTIRDVFHTDSRVDLARDTCMIPVCRGIGKQAGADG